MADLIFMDKRPMLGSISIINLFLATEKSLFAGLGEAIKRIDNTADHGFVPGPIVLPSRSKGIHLLTDTIKLLPSRVPFRMGALDTIGDAVTSLGLLELRQEIMHFWNETHSLSDGR